MRAAVAVLLLSVLLMAAACGGGPQAPQTPPVTLRTGVNPVAVAERGGAVWVANAGEGTVWKIDLRSGRRIAQVKVGDAARYGKACEARNIHRVPHGSFDIRMCDLPRGMALASSGLWVIANDRNALLRVDPASARVVNDIPIGVAGWYVTVADDAVWVSDFDNDTLVRVDPRSNRVVATISGLPHGPTQMVVTPEGLWVACSRADVVARLDPATNHLAATVAVGHTPLPIVAAFGSVWVRNENAEHDGTVSRIDPVSGSVVASVPVGLEMGRDGLDGLAATDRGLWVSGLDLEEIDPSKNQVVRHANHTSNSITTGETALWTIDIAYSVTRRPLT